MNIILEKSCLQTIEFDKFWNYVNLVRSFNQMLRSHRLFLYSAGDIVLKEVTAKYESS